jgi:hypothetical protein
MKYERDGNAYQRHHGIDDHRTHVFLSPSPIIFPLRIFLGGSIPQGGGNCQMVFPLPRREGKN